MSIPTAFDSKYEVEFYGTVAPELGRMGVTVTDVRHVESMNVLSMVIQLPPGARIGERREILRALAEFEHRFDHAVITDPAFIWSDDGSDD